MIHNKSTFTLKTWVYPKIVVIILSTAFLSACGSDGDGGGTNNPPTVTAQTFSVESGGTLTENIPGVLDGSSDPDNDTLIAILVSDASHGALTLNDNGSFEYVHSGSSSATDSFTFKANDGTSDSNTASVTININGIPVIASSACRSVEDLPIDLNEFVNDPDGDMLGFSIETQASEGMAILQPDGILTSYTPNNPDATGFHSFTYQVDDNNGGTSIGTVNIAVSKTRIMPLGDSITVGDGLEGAGCSVDPPEVIPAIERIGYRDKLFTDLDQDNYMVDFVGSISSGLSAVPPIEDPHHEGIGGNEASLVLARVTTALIANPTDIVLLHVGTNNINNDPGQPGNLNDTISNIGLILDAIDFWEASNNEVTVLLSTIIERSTKGRCEPNPTYNNPNVSTLNGLISNLVTSRPTDKLVLVDQHEAINNPATQLSADGIHPSPSGYRIMADEWFEKLTDASNNITILRCPTN